MGFLNPFMEARASSGNMPERVREPMMATDEKRRPNWKGKNISQADPAFNQADAAFSQAHTTSCQADPATRRQEGERFKKHKRVMSAFEKQLLTALNRAEASSTRHSEDPDEQFIRSLLPQIKSLKPGRKERLKFEIHLMVFEAQCSQEEEESGYS
ncbi:hypothetical protein ABG768_018816 [Culter alburnus]|uniref:BESS domain-containing protein n=1 Tax=Culter alburnus TaxID=194366 RepID=A0AAW2AY18_CULAL